LKSGDFLFANPSSQHSFGKASRKQINEAREFIYSTFNQSERESRLFFHSGATEAFVTFAYSFAEEARLHGKELLICYSQIDHPAVTTLTERFFGSHVKFFELKRNQKLEYMNKENFEALKDKKDNNPDLIILYHHLWVHNETGFISPLEALSQFKSIPDLYVHVDAVQSPGKIQEWHHLVAGDIWSYSAHKFGAMKGTGFTFIKNEVPYHPLFTGGGQQLRLRSGTENPMTAKMIALALEDLMTVDINATIDARDKLQTFLDKELAGIGTVVSAPRKASNTIYFFLHDLTSDIALALFDLEGLMISAGSACMSGTAKASTLLTHMGLSDVAKNGLRISLPFTFSNDELLLTQQKLQNVVKKLRSQKT
jgi:cysteine desulfurase